MWESTSTHSLLLLLMTRPLYLVTAGLIDEISLKVWLFVISGLLDPTDLISRRRMMRWHIMSVKRTWTAKGLKQSASGACRRPPTPFYLPSKTLQILYQFIWKTFILVDNKGWHWVCMILCQFHLVWMSKFEIRGSLMMAIYTPWIVVLNWVTPISPWTGSALLPTFNSEHLYPWRFFDGLPLVLHSC